jgi:hypothetical protein
MPVSDAIFFSAEATPHLASTCQSPATWRLTPESSSTNLGGSHSVVTAAATTFFFVFMTA